MHVGAESFEPGLPYGWLNDYIGGGKEPPVSNAPSRRDPPEKPKKLDLGYEVGDIIGLLGTKLEAEVLRIEDGKTYFRTGNTLPTWLGSHQVVFVRKGRNKKNH